MKKIAILISILIVLAFLANANRNELAVLINAKSFYSPIFTSNFNILKPGSTVRAELNPSYDVQHGFFLTFPCEYYPLDYFADLDGSIRYTFWANGIEIESKTISMPPHPMGGLSDDLCDIVLFTFDLPYKGHDIVTLEVVLETPITKLAAYKDIQCEVSPAYWPK